MDLQILGQTMTWNRLDLLRPESKCACVVTGQYGAVFVLRFHNDECSLTRTNTQNVVMWEIPVAMGAGESTCAVDSNNNVLICFRGSTAIKCVCVSHYATVLWEKTMAVTGANAGWKSCHIAGDDLFYVGLAFVGEWTSGKTVLHGDSAVMALNVDGDMVWVRKILGALGGICCNGASKKTIYCAGVFANKDVFLHELSTTGTSLREKTIPNLHALYVSGVTVNTASISVCGAINILNGEAHADGEPHVFHLQSALNDTTVEMICVLPTKGKLVHSELVSVGSRAVLCVAIEDQGSRILDGDVVTHHFSDNLLHSSPQLQFAGSFGNNSLFLKCGSFVGKLNIDKSCYEIGRCEAIGYFMQFFSGRIRL